MKNLIPILVVALAAGCGSSSARVHASITDAPLNLANVAHVNITVSEVRVKSDTDQNENEGEKDESADGGIDAHHVDGGTADDHGHHEAANDGARGKGWVVLCATPQTFDLTALTNGNFAPLCSGAVIDITPGHVSKIWLGVTAAQIVFKDATPPFNLTVPRGNGNGLVIDVDDVLEKDKDGELKVDFVASSSITDNLDGTFSFHPTVKEVHGH